MPALCWPLNKLPGTGTAVGQGRRALISVSEAHHNPHAVLSDPQTPKGIPPSGKRETDSLTPPCVEGHTEGH